MDCNIQNRTIFCRDNLEILQGINSNCIDLIYLDPPFNKKKVFTAPIGSSAEGASFSDIFREKDVKDEWVLTIQEDHEEIYSFLTGIKNYGNKYNYCYLVYMCIRLMEMHRILKDTGSIYLHCDPTMSHYLKILLDCIFGEKSFRNEIVWFYPDSPGRPSKDFPRKHDTILRYTKGISYIFDTEKIRVPILEESKNRYKTARVIGGKQYIGGASVEKGKIPESVWRIPVVKRNSKQATDYPTQKPIALLERIIQASSQEGEIVLDPFCGCATTCVAAEKWARQWIGIDVSHKAYELVQKRLRTEVEEKRDLFDPDKDVHYSTSSPKRTDIGADYREQKYVYIISNVAFPNMYKVGIAKDWKSRLNSYQTSDPDRGYKMEFHYLTPCFREIESHIHNRFESKHEWVTADLAALREAIENYKQKV